MTSQSQRTPEKDQEAESIRLMLDAIETRERVTQRSLSGELGIALGLTNIYLKRCINKGLIKVRKAPARRYAYYLTARGFAEKARLTAKYLTRSLSYFRVAREDCSELLAACRARGISRVVLVGAGDLCEIATLAALDHGVQVVAVLDAATNRQQVAGVRVIRELADLDGAGPEPGGHEAVVITDMKDPQGAYERMVALLGQERVLAPSLLRLSRPGGSQLAATR